MLPHEAYADAPPILTEMNAVLALTKALPTLTTPERIREQQLRKAALLDRIALRSPEDKDAACVAADAALALFVLDHGPVDPSPAVGCHAPHDWHGDEGPRHYLRQQYAAWRR